APTLPSNLALRAQNQDTNASGEKDDSDSPISKERGIWAAYGENPDTETRDRVLKLTQGELLPMAQPALARSALADLPPADIRGCRLYRGPVGRCEGRPHSD